jgi:hypothetical protein
MGANHSKFRSELDPYLLAYYRGEKFDFGDECVHFDDVVQYFCIYKAASEGDEERLDALIMKYGNKNSYPIIRAARDRDFAALKVLIKEGWDVNVRGETSRGYEAFDPVYDQYPIHFACEDHENGKLFAFELVRNGADLYSRGRYYDRDSFEPLEYAYSQGNYDVVLLLIQAGASLNYFGRYKMIMDNHLDIKSAELLLKFWDLFTVIDLSIHANQIPPLLNFVHKLKIEMVEDFLCLGADINSKNMSGENIGVYAFDYGAIGLRFLLERGLDPNIKVPAHGHHYFALSMHASDIKFIPLLFKFCYHYHCNDSIQAYDDSKCYKCREAFEFVDLLFTYGAKYDTKVLCKLYLGIQTKAGLIHAALGSGNNGAYRINLKVLEALLSCNVSIEEELKIVETQKPEVCSGQYYYVVIKEILYSFGNNFKFQCSREEYNAAQKLFEEARYVDNLFKSCLYNEKQEVELSAMQSRRLERKKNPYIIKKPEFQCVKKYDIDIDSYFKKYFADLEISAMLLDLKSKLPDIKEKFKDHYETSLKRILCLKSDIFKNALMFDRGTLEELIDIGIAAGVEKIQELISIDNIDLENVHHNYELCLAGKLEMFVI